MNDPKVYVHPRSYEVTIWPEDEGGESINASAFCLTVEYRGAGRWGVFRGTSPGRHSPCMDRSGVFGFGPDRDDEGYKDWLAGHRFTRTEALELAAEWAPKFRSNGYTPAEVLAGERAKEKAGA